MLCVFTEYKEVSATRASKGENLLVGVAFEVIKQISLSKKGAGVTASTALGPVILFNQLPQAFLSGVTSSAPFRVMT